MVMASVTWVLLLWFKSRVFRPAPAGSLAADAHGRLPLQWPASDGFDGRRDSRVAPGPEFGEGLLAFAELDAVHDRHHQIEEDDGRLGVAEARQRIAAV